jgi:hypothetical protein
LGVGLGVAAGVAAARAGVGVGVGPGVGDGTGVAGRASVAGGEMDPVAPVGKAVDAGAVGDGVGRTVTGIEPRASALTPLSSAEPAITRAAMTTRALFIAYQTPGPGPGVHAIVHRSGR